MSSLNVCPPPNRPPSPSLSGAHAHLPAQNKFHTHRKKTSNCSNANPQQGFSLIEVLISVLILSFGMLALGLMLSSSVMMPKLSGYRTSAITLASSHIERMRANPGRITGSAAGGFNNGDYDKISYDGTFSDIPLVDCSYPNCTESSLAAMDNAASQRAVRLALPAGGLFMRRDNISGTTSLTVGNLWVVWQDPSSNATLNPSSSDNCPVEITAFYTTPKPRCIYVRFKL